MGMGPVDKWEWPQWDSQAHILFLGKSSNPPGLLPHPWDGEVSRELLGAEGALQCL